MTALVIVILGAIVVLSVLKPQSASALGAIAIAVLAIWGDWVRKKFGIRPKLELSLYSDRGKYADISEGGKGLFYHVRVKNKRSWIPAKRVRILINY